MLLRDTFPATKIYPSLGNRDSFPANQVPSGPADYYDNLLTSFGWDTILSSETIGDFKKGKASLITIIYYNQYISV